MNPDERYYHEVYQEGLQKGNEAAIEISRAAADAEIAAYTKGQQDRMAMNCGNCKYCQAIYDVEGLGDFDPKGPPNYWCHSFEQHVQLNMTCPDWQAKEKGETNETN